MQRGFLLAEDEALKAKLSGLSVAEKNGRKNVKLWFRQPSAERELSWPFITIDLIDVVFAAERAHSAQYFHTDGWPSEYPTMAEWAAANDVDLTNAVSVESMSWLPYDLYYQVATYTRFAQHDRELTARLLSTNYLPYRFGYLDVPADESCRWLDLEGYTSADYIDPQGKAVFRKVYNIRVSAHVPPEDPVIFYKVLAANFSLKVVGESSVNETWSHATP